MSVKRLHSEVDSAEMTEWIAFERMEPFGALATEMRLGTIAASTYNSRRTAKTDKFITPGDLMPALRAALERSKAPAAAASTSALTDDQYADMFDAEIFGVVH